jgi:hypothetical protein
VSEVFNGDDGDDAVGLEKTRLVSGSAREEGEAVETYDNVAGEDTDIE